MTELLSKELSRRSFLKRGGGLVVGFAVGSGAVVSGQARAAVSPYASNGPYDMYQVDSWVKVRPDNTAGIYTGRIELGQGTSVGLLQIAGEELDMDMSQLEFVLHDTNVTPDTGRTAASSSIKAAGPQVRAAAATAKQALLGLASASLGVPISALTVSKGVVSGGGKSVSYGALLGDKLFNVRMPASYAMNPGGTGTGNPDSGLAPGVFPAKSPTQYTLVGTRVPRSDIPAKVMGRYAYIHNVRVPGMLHGRVVRPRGQGAYGDGTLPKVVSIDESSIKNVPGARVVRKGEYVGVVAENEYDAIRAAAQLKVTWSDPPALPGSGNLWKQMRTHDSAGQAPARVQLNTGNVDTALASAAKTVSATYSYHYNGHAVIGPSCAVATVNADGALIMCNSQDAYVVRSKLQPLLNLPLNKIRVQYWEGSSSYGNSQCRYETALAAGVIAQAAGKPVRLQFMRWDEHGWDNFGPAQTTDIRGGVDASGRIVAMDYTGFQIPAYSTDPSSQMLGIPLATPGLGSVEAVVTGTQYTIPNLRKTAKSLPAINTYFKTATVRSPGGPQAAFAWEQMIDELAYAAKMDPYQFRVLNVSTTTDPTTPWYFKDRWLGVMDAAARAAGWKPHVAASNLSNETTVRGRGFAASPHGESLAAVVADIEVNRKSGKIVATNIWAAQDAGLTINPALVENQIIGTVIQTASRVLLEAVAFDRSRVTSLDWVSYPILRFKDSPKVTPIVVQRIDKAPRSSGEIPVTGTVGAIANAFFDATGVRIREAPMNPGRVRAVLQAAGKGGQ